MDGGERRLESVRQAFLCTTRTLLLAVCEVLQEMLHLQYLLLNDHRIIFIAVVTGNGNARIEPRNTNGVHRSL